MVKRNCCTIPFDHHFFATTTVFVAIIHVNLWRFSLSECHLVDQF